MSQTTQSEWQQTCKAVIHAAKEHPTNRHLQYAATYASIGTRTYDVRSRATAADMMLRETRYWRGDDAKKVRDSLKAFKFAT